MIAPRRPLSHLWENVKRERERRPEDLVELHARELAVGVELEDGVLAVDDEAGGVRLRRVLAARGEVALAVVAPRREQIERVRVGLAQRDDMAVVTF